MNELQGKLVKGKYPKYVWYSHREVGRDGHIARDIFDEEKISHNVEDVAKVIYSKDGQKRIQGVELSCGRKVNFYQRNFRSYVRAYRKDFLESVKLYKLINLGL